MTCTKLLLRDVLIIQGESGPKNYSWRKDMEGYEEKLEQLQSHKRNVHEATKATRLVVY